jgi:hypothetical protein
MHSKPTRMVIPLFLALAGCKKSQPASMGSTDPVPATQSAAPPPSGNSVPVTSPVGSAAPELPPAPLPAAFTEFEAVLVPLTREPESDARSRRTCKAFTALKVKSLAIRRNMPVGVHAEAWEKASNEIRGALEGLGQICTDDTPDDSMDLPTLHLGYQHLVALLPK